MENNTKLNSKEVQKKIAAEKALDFVEAGMILGLGTGSTVRYFLEALARKIEEGKLGKIVGISSSENTAKLAGELEIPLSTLDEHPLLDLDIDGADQVDSEFNLVKGGGGAHTREKILAFASKKFVVIVDANKLKEKLSFPVPVEVPEDSRELVERKLRELGGEPKLRENFITDNGNVILDTDFGEIENPGELEVKINEIPGVVDNGIFSKRKPEKVIVGYEDGKVEIRERG